MSIIDLNLGRAFEKEPIELKAWQIELMWFFPNTLTASNCFHVTLLVFLRLIALEMPDTYEDTHRKIRHIGVVIIWVGSAMVCSLPLINTFRTMMALQISWHFVIHGCHTLPICLIVILYGRVLWRISRTRIRRLSLYPSPVPEAIERAKLAVRTKKNKVSRVIAANVVRLIICYVPYIVAWQINVTYFEDRDFRHQTPMVRINKINLISQLTRKLIFGISESSFSYFS